MLAPNILVGTKISGILCIFILCGILVAGLWPFHSPVNQVTWLRNANGLCFGDHGTVLSARAFRNMGSEGDDAGSLEIWIEPGRTSDWNTILAFYAPEKRLQFSLHQSVSDLALRNDRAQASPRNEAYLDDVFRRGRLIHVAIASGEHGTRIYLNGALAKTLPQFPLSVKDFSSQLVIGTAPDRNASWSGQLRGLAIYQQELTPTQVSRHYETWKTMARPDLGDNEHALGLYLFDEQRGRIVHDHSGSGMDLYIPDRYMILHEKFLEPAWKEFNLHWGYWKNVLINIGGFIPLGFFCAYWTSARPLARPALVTILFGATVSLTIEVLQAYLPTRDSGTTDLITNTLGTGLGVMLYRWKPSILTNVLSSIPFTARTESS
jgi:VanZ like protein/concanavalin A-like lectin/glucanase superfamily protein